MPLKPHVKLNTSEQRDKTVTLKFNYGFGDDKELDDELDKNYRPMAQDFLNYLTSFKNNYQTRIAQRNPAIQSPVHIEYIQILFQSQFTISDFYNKWYNEFGLLGIHFAKFNHQILFAIEDHQKFSSFLQNIENFILKESGDNPDAAYSSKILYVKEFKLLSSDDIIQFHELGSLMNIRLVEDQQLGLEVFENVLIALLEYLDNNTVQYKFSAESKNLEVVNASQQQLMEIAQNFDIVLHITSSLATVIGPSEFNVPERSYGFEISNAHEELPVIGIIDSGISNQTPLAPILINDTTFNLTASNVFEDETNHGTAVAALAALGKKPYAIGYRGEVSADAKLLSIKVTDSKAAYLSQADIITLLKKVKGDYPGIKIFVLTICFQHPKHTNEDYSSYAFELDKFSHENNCLISICTANNLDAAAHNTFYDLTYFSNDHTNICSPAESMNNLTVGAAAHSLRTGNFAGIADSREYPALYSRKSHIDLYALFPKNKINKQYFKPDIIECGGDYEYNKSRSFFAQGNNASMELLSSEPNQSFFYNIGSSFSAPLIANTAAQIQRMYPQILAQSIKALIVNGASLDLLPFEEKFKKLQNKTAGHGLANEMRSIFSNDNTITFLIEDEIKPEEVKIFPLHFPKYLVEDNLGKHRGILSVSATLCFSFLPVLNQQLSYCPVHIAFSFFKNQSGEDILATEDAIKSLLKSTLRWSQSGRHVSKPIPYSNTQKITFPVNIKDLVNENSTFKLAVNCRVNPQLLPGTERPYVDKAHSFSIAITVEETLVEKNLTGKLYNEMIAINLIENITNINLDAQAAAEGEL